jgi:hypothetical protein
MLPGDRAPLARRAVRQAALAPGLAVRDVFPGPARSVSQRREAGVGKSASRGDVLSTRPSLCDNAENAQESRA